MSDYNRVIDFIGAVFVFIFTVEAMVKIFALGLVCGQETYLKDGWNVLDFFIVVTGVVELILE